MNVYRMFFGVLLFVASSWVSPYLADVIGIPQELSFLMIGGTLAFFGVISTRAKPACKVFSMLLFPLFLQFPKHFDQLILQRLRGAEFVERRGRLVVLRVYVPIRQIALHAAAVGAEYRHVKG